MAGADCGVQPRGRKRREFHPLYPFLESGLYSEPLRRYLDLFPREQIRIYIYEEAWKDAPGFVRDIFEFLEVDAGFAADFSKRERARRTPRLRGLR